MKTFDYKNCIKEIKNHSFKIETLELQKVINTVISDVEKIIESNIKEKPCQKKEKN
jgi:hypothetical protein